MKIKISVLLFATLLTLSVSSMAVAQTNNSGAPWLNGVTVGPHPSKLSPVVPMKLYLENGDPLPATFTEDVPISVIADTSLFEDEPPAKANGVDIPNPKWLRKVSISWYLTDWETHKRSLVSYSQPHASNEMVIKPLTPTGIGSIICYASRKMQYDLPQPGETQGSFANSSVAHDMRVLDITPPTLGLQVAVKGGKTGVCWVTENPPNKYPLPKLADVCFSGPLVDSQNPDEIIPIEGVELGNNMVIDPKQVGIHVSRNAVITLNLNGKDNYKLNNNKIKYGICSGAGGDPVPVGQICPTNIDLSKLKLPKKPYLYVDATDMAGNREVLYIPLIVR